MHGRAGKGEARRGKGGIGVLECWSVGVLECWSVGALERWSVGALLASDGLAKAG